MKTTKLLVRASLETQGAHGCSTVPHRESGMVVTFTVVILLSIGLLLLAGPFEMARATWLMSQASLTNEG